MNVYGIHLPAGDLDTDYSPRAPVTGGSSAFYRRRGAHSWSRAAALAFHASFVLSLFVPPVLSAFGSHDIFPWI